MRSGDRRAALLAVAGVASVVMVGGVLAVGLLGRGSTNSADPGPLHVHGLGIDPADQALFIATHRGLYRVPRSEHVAQRVSDRDQDTMAFTVIGRNRFLGSGHPDLRDDLPPLLGLIESTDAGKSWTNVSLLGEADFHVLRSAGERIYGYDSSGDRLLMSDDGGRTWRQLERPGQVLDLAVSPSDPDHLVLSSSGKSRDGLFESRDGGHSWRFVNDATGFLGWPAASRLFIATAGGEVYASSNAGRTLARAGAVGGEPAAFLAERPSELYVALHDGTVQRSLDGGRTWDVRSTP